MADVFISYHEVSAGELAQQIAETLEKAGISCWVARRDMPVGGNFANEIPLQIDTCELFLLLLNEKACQSKHVANEVTLAFGRLNKRNDIKILPLKIGKFQEPDWIHYFLALIQSVPFSAQPNAQQIHQLLERIAELLNHEPPQALTEPPPVEPGPSLKLSHIIDGNVCGKRVIYLLDDAGQMVVSGVGAMRDYQPIQNAPWYSQREKILNVVILNGVTSVGRLAFSYCVNLRRVVIPESVTFIGERAFRHCHVLESAIISSGVVSIGKEAFEYCHLLREVSIPTSVTFIGNNAFTSCGNLTRFSIPANMSLDMLHNAVSSACENIITRREPDAEDERPQSIIVETVDSGECGDNVNYTLDEKGLLTISGQGPMRNCQRKAGVITTPWYPWREEIIRVYIQEGVTSIGAYAFAFCENLQHVSIPHGVTSIEKCAFRNCSRLTDVYIPDSVKSIGSWAFKHTISPYNIRTPPNVKTGYGAFEYLPYLTPEEFEQMLKPLESSSRFPF